MKKIIIAMLLISTLVMLSGCSSLSSSKGIGDPVVTVAPDTTAEPTATAEPTTTPVVTAEPTSTTAPVVTAEPTPTPEPVLTADELYALGNESYSAGLSRDAFNYYTAASELGSAEAYCMLAHCYEAGVGTPIDNDLAYKYYEISANAGCDRAQFRMGFYYTCDSYCDYSIELHGLGLDEEQAEKWFLLVADNSTDEDLKILANEALDYIYGGYPSYCKSLEDVFETFSFWSLPASREVDFSISSKRP